jgi:hypothetical protein
MKKPTKKTAKRKVKAGKRTGRTGRGVASTAGKLLAELKSGKRVYLADGKKPWRDITDRAERVFASALVQREAPRP